MSERRAVGMVPGRSAVQAQASTSGGGAMAARGGQALLRKDANPSAAILVSKRRQTGNPLLRFIKNVRWQYVEDLVPDYQMGKSTVALFLSLKYHLLHPQYIHFRIRELQRSFRLRVLLLHVDVDDPVKPLTQVTKLACLSDFTLVCGWSYEECARYLETYKTYESKPHDLLLGTKTNVSTEDYTARVTQCLTQIRGVNRTDVLTLTARFGTLREILQASEEDLSGCPGLGPAKVKRLFDAFRSDFLGKAASRKGAAPSASPSASAPATSAAKGQKPKSAAASANAKKRKFAGDASAAETGTEPRNDAKRREGGKPPEDFNIEAFL